MDLMPALSQIKAELAAAVIVGRILLLITARRDDGNSPASSSPDAGPGLDHPNPADRPRSTPTRSTPTREPRQLARVAAQVAVAAAQIASAMLTIVDWLHGSGLV